MHAPAIQGRFLLLSCAAALAWPAASVADAAAPAGGAASDRHATLDAVIVRERPGGAEYDDGPNGRLPLKTNVTLIFTVSQGLMAMKAGATFISPFVGRLEDIGTDAYQLIADLRTIIDIYDFEAEIIAASIRNAAHVEAVAKLGAHIATIPDNLFEKMTQHPLTTNGIAQFMKDWEAFKK